MAATVGASEKGKEPGADKSKVAKDKPAKDHPVDVIDLWKAAAVTKPAAALALRGGVPEISSPGARDAGAGPFSDSDMDKVFAQEVRKRMEAQSAAGPYIKIDQSAQSLDPKHHPTVAVLDDFSQVVYPLSRDKTGPTGLTHGDVTLQAAKQAGFDAIKVELLKDYKVDLTHSDWSKPLNEIADAVKDGRLPLKPDDYVNVSLGDNKIKDKELGEIPGSGNPTFEDASKFLGMNVNADNLKDQRDAIINKLRDIAKDDKRDWMDRRVAQSVVDTNDAIDRLHAMGIKVAHAAGNDGPGRFDWNFLKADLQFSEKDPSGAMSPLSADNSLTTPVAVPREIRFSGADLLDPTPIAEQRGKYTLAQPIRKPDGKVEINPIASFDAKDVGGALDRRLGYFYLQSKQDAYGRLPYMSGSFDELAKTTAYGKDPKALPHFATPAPEGSVPSYEQFQKSSPAHKFHIKMIHPYAQPQDQRERLLSRELGYGDIQLLMDGTSFGFAASAKRLYEEWAQKHRTK